SLLGHTPLRCICQKV
ncbi:hypothetical protein D030_5177B, partial [Vibrio parahaemolyticus AQ3810]